MGLSNRGRSFEDKFQNDTFLKFKVIARRNKKIGLWASKLLGIPPGQAEAFINDVVAKITNDPDDSQLIGTLIQQLKENYITLSENQIRRQIGIFYQEAALELANEER